MLAGEMMRPVASRLHAEQQCWASAGQVLG